MFDLQSPQFGDLKLISLLESKVLQNCKPFQAFTYVHCRLHLRHSNRVTSYNTSRLVGNIGRPLGACEVSLIQSWIFRWPSFNGQRLDLMMVAPGLRIAGDRAGDCGSLLERNVCKAGRKASNVWNSLKIECSVDYSSQCSQ